MALGARARRAYIRVWQTPVVWRSVYLQYSDALWRLWLERMTSKMGSELRASACLTLEMIFLPIKLLLQRLRLCRASGTVFRREIDSQRQWGYGTCCGNSFPSAKECNKKTSLTITFELKHLEWWFCCLDLCSWGQGIRWCHLFWPMTLTFQSHDLCKITF